MALLGRTVAVFVHGVLATLSTLKIYVMKILQHSPLLIKANYFT